jgi:hypothetical protein
MAMNTIARNYICGANNQIELTAMLNSLNKNEGQRLEYEVEADIYWNRRFKTPPERLKLMINRSKKLLKRIKKIAKKGFQPELSKFGNEIVRATVFNTSMLHALYLDSSFESWGGGCDLHCVYYSESKQTVVYYCEGDVTLYKGTNLIPEILEICYFIQND